MITHNFLKTFKTSSQQQKFVKTTMDFSSLQIDQEERSQLEKHTQDCPKSYYPYNSQINLKGGIVQLKNKSQISCADMNPFLPTYSEEECGKFFSQDNSSLSIEVLEAQFENKKIDNDSISTIKINKKKSKIDKNANVIKKLGKIIIDHRSQYQGGLDNLGIQEMDKSLTRDANVGRRVDRRREKFKIQHLKNLVGTGPSALNSRNMRSTRQILNRYMRKDVMESRQIKGDSKITYLNTLKCCSIRCMNKNLIARLQIARIDSSDKMI